MSGSAYSSWALVEDPVIYAVKLAKELNCSIPDDLVKDHESIVDCLREVSLEDLYAVDIQPPNFLSAFGPSVDGVVIRPGRSNQDLDESTRASKRNQATMPQYDILISAVTGEALWRFSASDIQSGFEGDRRDKIIRTYVRNAYNYHLSEIFYTISESREATTLACSLSISFSPSFSPIVTEYTDWERTNQHPIITRDSAVSALSDAQYVAPLVHTADLSTSTSGTQEGENGPKCFFSVFDYQTKDGDYPQRMGTVHGEDLPYVFGAPLIDGFSHFPRNYTKSEIALSEAIMIYWSNFVRTGYVALTHTHTLFLSRGKRKFIVS
jgi:neuroligin